MPLLTVDKPGPYEILSRLGAGVYAMEFMEGEMLDDLIKNRIWEQPPVGGAQPLEAIVDWLALPKNWAHRK